MGPRRLEGYVQKNLEIGGGGLGRRQPDRDDLSFDQNFALFRLQNPGRLLKLTLTAAPSCNHEQPWVTDRHGLGNNCFEQPDEDEFSIPLLSDVVAENTGLEIWDHGICRIVRSIDTLPLESNVNPTIVGAWA